MKHFIYFHYNTQPDANSSAYLNLSWLNDSEYDKIFSYHRIQDKMNGVIGKLLLRHALEEHGFHRDFITKMKYTEQKRPYLDIPCDFNISHCDDLVVLAFTEKYRLGIDVEQLVDRQISDFQSCFTISEWNEILSADDQCSRFYYYWTRKEAVLKAIGSGLLIHPSLFDATQNIVRWQDKTWYLHPIDTKINHICYLATEDCEAEIVVKESIELFRYA